jgi:hypothetical protein
MPRRGRGEACRGVSWRVGAEAEAIGGEARPTRGQGADELWLRRCRSGASRVGGKTRGGEVKVEAEKSRGETESMPN